MRWEILLVLHWRLQMGLLFSWAHFDWRGGHLSLLMTLVTIYVLTRTFQMISTFDDIGADRYSDQNFSDHFKGRLDLQRCLLKDGLQLQLLWDSRQSLLLWEVLVGLLHPKINHKVCLSSCLSSWMGPEKVLSSGPHCKPCLWGGETLDLLYLMCLKNPPLKINIIWLGR